MTTKLCIRKLIFLIKSWAEREHSSEEAVSGRIREGRERAEIPARE